eukprot:2128884-Prymnesium_polylepis.1
MEEASSAGHVLLRRMIKLHCNWKYIFIRPTAEEVCARDLAKHGQGGARPPHMWVPRRGDFLTHLW